MESTSTDRGWYQARELMMSTRQMGSGNGRDALPTVTFYVATFVLNTILNFEGKFLKPVKNQNML
jgi:hypothetical protein